jgi:subtilase family serine protease
MPRIFILRARTVTINGTTHFGPPDFYAFYDETPLLEGAIDGSGTDCIALLEDSNFSVTSANAFNDQSDLPDFTNSNLAIVAADSGAEQIFNGDQLEALVDLNYSHAIAPAAPIVVYIGNAATATTGSAIIDALRSAVSQNQCSSIVMSFSFCGVSNKFYKMVDSIFAQAAMQGQSVLVAAGDSGANGLIFNKKQNACVTAPGGKHPSEVAASPNVTAVGGTRFDREYVNGVDVGSVPEAVWND